MRSQSAKSKGKNFATKYELLRGENYGWQTNGDSGSSAKLDADILADNGDSRDRAQVRR